MQSCMGNSRIDGIKGKREIVIVLEMKRKILSSRVTITFSRYLFIFPMYVL